MTSPERRRRRQLIAKLHREGLSNGEIGKQLGITKQRVQQILAEGKKTVHQVSEVQICVCKCPLSHHTSGTGPCVCGKCPAFYERGT